MVKLISNSICRLSTPLFNVKSNKSGLPGCVAINLAIEFDEKLKNYLLKKFLLKEIKFHLKEIQRTRKSEFKI